MLDQGLLDQVTQQFLTALKQDAHLIAHAAQHLFLYLTVIQLSFTALWMVLAGESLQRMVSRLIQLFFIFGFFEALIQRAGRWVPAVLNGFIEIGQASGVTALDPSSIISQGVSIAAGILKAFFNWGLLGHPFVSMVGAIVCVAILLMYGLIAAELVMVLVKAYILVATGGLFFAFAGSDNTRAMAQRYIAAVIGLGLQLMSLYLLLGVGQQLGHSWAQMTAMAAQHHQLMPMLVILCAVMVYYLVLKNIPSFIAGLSGVGGFRHWGEAAVASVLNAATHSVNALHQAQRRLGGWVQGGTQSGLTLAQTAQHFMQGFKSAESPLQSVTQGVRSVASGLSQASANTLKDLALRQQPQLSVAEKFNQHLANSIQSKNKKTTSEEGDC